MKKALILHCWFGHPDENWYPWIKKELENRGYEVWIPDLPTMDTESPQMEPMLKKILDKNFVDENTLVIGHSLGSVLTLRLAEKAKFNKGILFAGWDFNDLTEEHKSFWQNMLDHQTIKENVSNWVVPISDNDPYISVFQTEEMAKRLGGTTLKLGNRGHFSKKQGNITQIPEILKYV